MPTLTFAALELPHRFGDAQAQLKLADRLLAEAHPADLAVLPECALTGYVSALGNHDLKAFAEPLDGPTSGRLADLARKHRLTLAGPLIESDGTRVFNSFVVFDPGGTRIAHYRKRNPFTVETWATPGDLGNPVFEIAGVRATIAICFDLHFLERDATEALTQAQVLLFPSAWVLEDGPDERDTRLPQIAEAFDVGIVNANWGVGSPLVKGQGDSRILDPQGRELSRSVSKGEGAIARARIVL